MRDSLPGSLVRLLPLLLVAGTSVACKREPVSCEKFAREAGSRASLTQLDKATRTFRWSECTDKKTRLLYCTTGHLHRTSCTCELHEGERRTEGRVKTDDDMPEDQATATAFANRWCEFRLK